MSPNAAYNLALEMPIERLKAILQGRPDLIDQSTAMLALKQKMSMRTALDGQAARAQIGQPSVKDRLLASSGISAAPAGAMSIPAGGITGEPEGPVVRAAEGGAVKHFAGEGPSLVGGRGYDLFGDYIRLRQQRANEVAVLRGTPIPYPEAGYLKTVYPSNVPVERQNEGWMTNEAGEPVRMRVASELVSEPTAEDVAAYTPKEKPKAKGPATPPRPSQKLPPATAQLPMAVPPPSRRLEQTEIPEPTLKETMAGIGDFTKYAESLTAAERKALEDAVQGRRTRLEGQAETRKGEARGLAALQAAGELLKGGRHRATSIGAAFSAAGKEGAEYVKEEKKIADSLDQADLAYKQAVLTGKQGDVKLGATLMTQAQDRALKAADMRWKQVYDIKLAELKEQGLSDEKAYRAATVAADREKNAILAQHYKDWKDVFAGKAVAAATPKVLTQKDLAAIYDKALDNVRNDLKDREYLMQVKKQFPPGTPNSEIIQTLAMRQLQGTVDFATKGIAGLPGAAGNPAYGPRVPEGVEIRRPLVPTQE